MAIINMDNFSIYGTTTALLTQGVYIEENVLSLDPDPDGTSSGYVIRINTSVSVGLRFANPGGPNATAGIAQRFWATALPANGVALVGSSRVRGAGNESLAIAGFTSNGAARVMIYDASNVLQTVYDTGVPVVTANGWWHSEFKYVKTGTNTCDFELRVEGQTVASGSGVSCRDIVPAQYVIGQYVSGMNISQITYFKDLVMWDGTSSYNNDFLGSVLVTNLVPTSDVALNWTPSTGSTGYEILDNIPPNDAQYLSAGDPPPSPYVAEVSDLPSDVTSVKAIMTRVRAAKTDGGDGSLQVGVISNGDTALGANRPITVTMTYWSDVFQTDPDTTAPWLPDAVDDVRLQINRTL